MSFTVWNFVVTVRRNACIASAVLATAIPSVCLSVCLSVRPSVCLSIRPSVSPSVTRRYCVKMTACSTVQFALSQQNVTSFVETKEYSPGTTRSPEILAQTDLPPPDSSESWHVLPCSASTVRAREKSSIMANRKSYMDFPTSHQPRFYAAPTFLKMGIKYLNLSSFIQVSTIKDEKSAAKFHCIKTVSGKVVAQSIAFRVVSIYWQGVAPFPWYLNAKGPTRIGRTCVAHTSPHSMAAVRSLRHQPAFGSLVVQ